MTDVSTPRSTVEEAQRRVDRIRGHVSSAWEEVITAYKHRDHEALGYGTGQSGWDAYILGEFGESRLSLPRHQRVEHVLEASAAGLSNRAIASAASVTEGTVRNDLRGQVRKSYAPASPASPAEVPTFDPTPSWDPVDTETGEIHTEPRSITGMDGKTYTRPEPKEVDKPKPEATTSQFSGAIADLNRVLDRLHRIAHSTHFPQNKNQVATLHGSDLDRAISELQTLADALN